MDDPDAVATEFSQFVKDSPTAFHAAWAVRDRLVDNGFTELAELDEWPAEPGAYVVVREGAVIAWRLPESASGTTPFRILGAHTDSPTFRIKPNPVTESAGWSQLNVEVYGGPILSTWFDRDLGIAGRMIDAHGVQSLFSTNGPVARIPNLAIHLDRGVNEGAAIDRQRQVLPVLGTTASEQSLGTWLNRILVDNDVPAQGSDLFLYDTQPPARVGISREFLAAARMDNLTSVHAGLRGLIDSPADVDHIAVLAAFDHEEIGSATPSGAAGPFLEDVLHRVHAGLHASVSDAARSLRGSWLLSSDAGHLAHPNQPEKHDPTNRPRPGGGPLLKVSANQRYVTGARGEALWRATCERADVRFQEFVNVNTIAGGSTIGPLASTRLGIPTVDIGVGLLSMHSARELVHVNDLAALHRAVAAFLRG
jgi:aspartyl aminopeptidase